MTLKVAVVGAGAMGKHHARLYGDIPGVTLVAIADIDEQAAKDIANRHHAKAYTDYKIMLAAERPDAVSIAVPTRLHRDVALEAIARGCHVLIEKPIALTEEEAKDMIDAANKAGVGLMVGHVERFNPAIQALKGRLKSHALGKVIHMEARRQGPFPERMQGIGVVIDLAVHDIDIMRFITGDEVERVYAETVECMEKGNEDILSGSLRMKGGIMGTLNINWITPTKIRELYVTGEQGMFMVNYLLQDLYFFENAAHSSSSWEALDVIRGVSEGRMIREVMQRKEPLRAELEAFVAAVLERKSMPVTGQDGLVALRIARAMLESGKIHNMVRL